MRYFFISNIETLTPLLDFNIEGINIDIHNEFDYKLVRQSSDSIDFVLNKSTDNNLYAETNAAIIFSGVVESNITFVVRNQSSVNWKCLTNFARGELLEGNKYSLDDTIKYFFMQFEGDETIDIFCKEAIIVLW